MRFSHFLLLLPIFTFPFLLLFHFLFVPVLLSLFTSSCSYNGAVLSNTLYRASILAKSSFKNTHLKMEIEVKRQRMLNAQQRHFFCLWWDRKMDAYGNIMQKNVYAARHSYVWVSMWVLVCRCLSFHRKRITEDIQQWNTN